MPIHDWTRTYAGAFHYFHVSWLVRLTDALNEGVLARGYYAVSSTMPFSSSEPASNLLPAATLTAVADTPRYPPRPRVIAVRHVSHVSGDRLVAMIEIVSAGNKADAAEMGALVEKTALTLSKGVHVVLIDLQPRAVGERLPEIPLFLSPALHVALPLERTYQAAFDSLPAHLREQVLGDS